MRSKYSAGILVYRKNGKSFEVLLGHMGGPFWAKKDAGAWSIPKGEFNPEVEDSLVAAKREFAEEIGQSISGNFVDLDNVLQTNGKTVYCFAIESDFDTTKAKSNVIEVEWPPKSGKMIKIPEIDKVEWFTPAVAKQKIIKAQSQFIDRLAKKMNIKIKETHQQTSFL